MADSSTLFKPSLSYRNDNGTQIVDTNPKDALNHRSVVLLIHGYNNTLEDATVAYNNFLKLQSTISPVTANLVGVYWPGSNWEGAVYYMQAIPQAEKVAVNLARDLYNAAKLMTYLKFDIIAHSLGCRFTIETIRQLLIIKQSDPTLSGLRIGQVAFMAGAVPRHFLEDVNRLRDAINEFNGTLSLFSENDRVLKYAFPIGESVAGERLFPIALGRREWPNSDFLATPMIQKRNNGADHGDYWSGGSRRPDVQAYAASCVRNFMPFLGGLPDRTIDERATATIAEPLTRSTPVSRETPSRNI
jgi:hypothetical protein